MATTEARNVRVWRDEIDTRVQVAGSGPPLVFFHGAMGLQWDQFLDSLAETHTVYAPEHPGTTPGQPDSIKPLDNLWDLVLYYDELFDALELERPAVVGHSFGGMVAAEVAATNPGRVSKLVLLNPIGLWRDDKPVKNWMVTPPEELPGIVFADPEGPVAKQMFTMPEDEEQALEVQIQMMWSQACTGKFVWPIPDKGLKKRIHRIAADTLIIWGQQDGLISPVYADEFKSRIQKAKVELIDNAGHVPQLEQLETVSQKVRDFLAT